MRIHFYIYQARDGHRWQAMRSGRIVADSGEAYTKHSSCLRAVTRFTKAIERTQYDINIVGGKPSDGEHAPGHD